MSALNRCASVSDLRLLSQRRIPKALFDYYDKGSFQEDTIRCNSKDFDQIYLRQRVCMGLDSTINNRLESKMLGQPYKMPLAISPTGLAGASWCNGEVAAARAAEKFGVPFTYIISCCILF